MIKEDVNNQIKLIMYDCVEDVIPVDFQIDSLVKTCEDIKKKYGAINNIVYLAEECVKLSGMLRKHYDLSQENLDRYIDKDIMIQKLKAVGIRVPLGIAFDEVAYRANTEKYLLDIECHLSKYPFFTKPTNLCGSVSTCIVNNRDELVKWAEQKENHTYLMQEYIEGVLFHCEGFIKNSDVMYFSVFEYSNPGFFFSRGVPVGSISLPANELLTKRIRYFAENVLQKLGIIENGVAHIEIFLNEEDELIFLEAAARPPGLAGELLYQKHLNISITEVHLLLQLGACNYDFSELEISNYAVRYIYPFPSTGRISNRLKNIQINSECTEVFMPKIGDEIKKSRDLFNVAGTMVLWNKNYAELRSDFQALKNYIPFEIKAM